MNRNEHAFRLTVVHRDNQGELFDTDRSPYRHTVVASNRADNPAAIMAWYCQRSEVRQNQIKDIVR